MSADNITEESVDEVVQPEATTEAADTEETTAEVAEDNEVEELRREIEELKDGHLRLMAEYDNYRKRTMKEKSDLIKYGGEKIVTGFLDIMDDIDLAIKNMANAESVEGLVEGVELIQTKFISTLKAQGVNAIPCIGEAFDADVHDAVAIVPTEEADKKGKVIDCVQTGYTLNDKVIRHPKVVVGS